MGGLEPQESWGTSAFGKRLVWLLSCLKPQQILTNSFTTPLPHCPEETASQSHCRPFFFSAQVNARSFFFKKKKKILFFWPCWVFTAACGLSLIVVTIRGYSSLQCAGFSLQWLFLFWSIGSGVHKLQQLCDVGLVAPLHVQSSWTRGSSPCHLHWQADS